MSETVVTSKGNKERREGVRARKKQIFFSERMRTFPQTPGKGEKVNIDLEATPVGKVGRDTRKGPRAGLPSD